MKSTAITYAEGTTTSVVKEGAAWTCKPRERLHVVAKLAVNCKPHASVQQKWAQPMQVMVVVVVW